MKTISIPFAIIVFFAASLFASIEVPQDAMVVSTETKTVVETTTREWRRIEFEASPATGDVTVKASYEEVVRVGGQVKSARQIREAFIPWSQATNIAPALVLVREQFKSAMPMILTNTP
jgi:hypothetical protein